METQTLMETFQHFAHSCDSSLSETSEEGICSLCQEETSIQFTCYSCKFGLCKLCFKLSSKLSHSLDPEHFLEFLQRQPDHIRISFICAGCGYISSGSYYECKVCDIKIDPKCASIGITSRWDAKKTDHYSHRHVLTRCKTGWSNGTGTCFICERPYSDKQICHGCLSCLCFVHDRCLDLPNEIRHPAHRHLLKRLNYMQHRERKVQCDVCQESIHGVPFGCLNINCDFNIHMRCADSLLRSLRHQTHEHPLVYVPRNAAHAITVENPCKICEEPQKIWKNCYYKCIQCDWNFHIECLRIPDFVVSKFHHSHHIQCKLFLNEEYEYCDVCETIINLGSYAYSCNKCVFQAHIECIFNKQGKQRMMYLKDIYSCEEMSSKIKEDKLKIDDVKHTHILRSCNLKDKLCNICKQGPVGCEYGCEMCEFTAHQSCAGLAKRVGGRFHSKHPLILLPLPPVEKMDCDICKKAIDGFNLFCRTCGYIADIKCITQDTRHVPKVIIRWGGQCLKNHNLVQILGTVDSERRPCSICGEELYGESPSCLECKEIYHAQCLEVEVKVEHPFHYHPVYLCNEVKYGFNCGSCGDNIISYSYKCLECEDVYFHVNCSKLVEASLKFKKRHEHNLHRFVASVDCSADHDPAMIDLTCNVCKIPCLKIFYGCTKCNFYCHVECIGLPTYVKHRVHAHALILSHSLTGESCNKYCEICVKACDPMFPNYICTLCGCVLHPECALCWDDDWKATTEEEHKRGMLMLMVSTLKRYHTQDPLFPYV
ncbi:hypothetical protein IGI04_026550 [Brassica rapa subsp. trilocularis]|uniref:Phorbol-ester/DAG-type domain-containing protein n=1 Tax=Brassica rapa subsp. trilocularis TaxID=1813537 RepID=A0ABQ7KWQ1_BRACM|nr:hypothetical protein IGI04_026550 [Brassica rapa subsp. trilocularis]